MENLINETPFDKPCPDLEDGAIIALHLHNGLTVIAKLIEQNEEGFAVKRPTQIAVAPQGTTLMPWLSVGGTFPPLEQATIPYDLVTLPREAPGQYEELYRNMTGDIAVPQKQSLIIPG